MIYYNINCRCYILFTINSTKKDTKSIIYINNNYPSMFKSGSKALSSYAEVLNWSISSYKAFYGIFIINWLTLQPGKTYFSYRDFVIT